MPKQKSRNKKISDAMKKRWAAKKASANQVFKLEHPVELNTSDPTVANAVNSTFSGVAAQPRQQPIFVRIHRPDDSLITIEH